MSTGTQTQPVQGGTQPKVSFEKQLDRKLASLAGSVPQSWREFARANTEETAKDILQFVNTLSTQDYFFVEVLTYAFGQAAKKQATEDVILGTLTGDPKTQAQIQAVIERYIDSLVGSDSPAGR